MTEADFSEVPAVLGLHVLCVKYRAAWNFLYLVFGLPKPHGGR